MIVKFECTNCGGQSATMSDYARRLFWHEARFCPFCGEGRKYLELKEPDEVTDRIWRWLKAYPRDVAGVA